MSGLGLRGSDERWRHSLILGGPRRHRHRRVHVRVVLHRVHVLHAPNLGLGLGGLRVGKTGGEKR